MQIDNLTMKVVYTCGKRVLGEPLVAAKIEANRRGNITNRKLKERRAEIIYMAADELKIAGGEIPRRDQLRIQRKIERYQKQDKYPAKHRTPRTGQFFTINTLQITHATSLFEPIEKPSIRPKYFFLKSSRP